MHQANYQFLFDCLGWLGAILFLVSYFLLIAKYWKSTDTLFHLANIIGGITLGANAFYDHSYASAFINFCWAGIAIYGWFRDLKKSKPPLPDTKV